MLADSKTGNTTTYPAGTEIFAEGSDGNSLIYIISGSVKIIKQGIEIARREACELVGEMSLLESEPRSASVVAETDCEIREFSREEFASAIQETPELALTVMQNLSKKLRESDIIRLEELEHKNLTLTVKNKQLSEINSFLEELISQSSAAILIVDEHGRIRRSNPASDKIFWLENRDTKRSIFELFTNMNPIHQMWRSMSTRWSGECVIVNGKKQRSVFASVSRLQSKDNSNEYLLICEDISEIKRLNEQILRLERVSTAYGVASEIAHDIKNYLAAIQGYFELLQNGYSEEFRARHTKHISMIDKAIADMSDYVESVMSGGPDTATVTSCNLVQTIDALTRFLQPQTRFADIDFVTKLDPDFPKALQLDEAQIHRALLNILMNAADALQRVSDDRGKVIEVELHHDSQQARVILVISDNGCGIEPELLKNLFHKKITTKKRGHGIGLITVRKIIEAHGGNVVVESTPDVGSKFIISLPA